MTSSAGQRISCNVVETRRDDVARIFNIQRYSLNDGEGIRTVVFFKGCPHLCPWCANPESISGKIQTVRRESKCLHCAKCLRDADECPSGAFERIGRDISLDAGGVCHPFFATTAAMGCVMRHRNCRRRASQQAVTAGEIVR